MAIFVYGDIQNRYVAHREFLSYVNFKQLETLLQLCILKSVPVHKKKEKQQLFTI